MKAVKQANMLYLFIYFKGKGKHRPTERGRDREMEKARALVHLPLSFKNGRNNHGFTKVKLGDRNFIKISHVDGQDSSRLLSRHKSRKPD